MRCACVFVHGIGANVLEAVHSWNGGRGGMAMDVVGGPNRLIGCYLDWSTLRATDAQVYTVCVDQIICNSFVYLHKEFFTGSVHVCTCLSHRAWSSRTHFFSIRTPYWWRRERRGRKMRSMYAFSTIPTASTQALSTTRKSQSNSMATSGRIVWLMWW